MKRAGSYRKAWTVGAAVAALLVVLSACSQEGEGDRCDFDNGDSDCADGLICLPKSNASGRSSGAGTVNPPYNNADRCCPPDRSKATHPACTVPVSPVTGDAGTPSDSGPTPDATAPATDAGSDASHDADAASTSDAADASDSG